MTFVCPNCNNVLSAARHSGDFVHNCNDFANIPAVGQEDVPRIGNAEEFGGTFTEAPDQFTKQGIQNPLDGTKAGAMGFKSYKYTPRGNNVFTTRARTFYQYIENPEELSKKE